MGLIKIFVWFTATLMAFSFSIIGWMFLGVLSMTYMGSPDEVKYSISSVLCGTYWIVAIVLAVMS